MDLLAVLGLLFRWIHIASATALVGGVLFAHQAIARAEDVALVSRYARIFAAASALSLLSGLYNFLNKATPLPPAYHAVFGIKFLLALHVYAVSGMLGKAGATLDQTRRRLTGLVASGALILLLGAILRWLTK